MGMQSSASASGEPQNQSRRKTKRAGKCKCSIKFKKRGIQGKNGKPSSRVRVFAKRAASLVSPASCAAARGEQLTRRGEAGGETGAKQLGDEATGRESPARAGRAP